MSWLDKIKSDLTITTGDGAKYTPAYLNASKAKEFNVAMFEYIDVPGTFVSKKQPKGRRYNIEIYFQGEHHLDTSDAFDTSSDDPKAWTIQHPLYGSLLVQPLGLVFDNAALNVTKISGQVVETITDTQPQTKIIAADKINEDTALCNDQLSAGYANNVKAGSKDIAKLNSDATKLYTEGKKGITDNIDAEKYFNAFNTATTFINTITTDPLMAMRKIQAMINAPALFANGVKNRLDTLIAQANLLRTSVNNSIAYSFKMAYEHNAGIIIASIMQATITNILSTDYTSRSSVLDTIDNILGAYNNYLVDLDTMQSINGGAPLSYIPNPLALITMSRLVNFTISNLFVIANNSKQERTVILPEDTDLVQLAKKYYGLKQDDSTIDFLRETNHIGIDEILLLKKGRQIIYYV
jgi:hypothetical protein